MKERFAGQLTSVHNVVMLAGLLGVGLTGSIAVAPTTTDTLSQRLQAGKVLGEPVAQAPAELLQEAPAMAPLPTKGKDYFDQLRSKMKWLPVKYGGDMLKTPDARSRILLAQSAAQRAGLHEVGLSYRDVYGIINAETTWIPRTGASKNGTPNLGIAQFEPATAKAVGLENPGDPVEAVHAAAMHMKDAAKWSAKRIENLKLSPEQRAIKLREGVSIFYNLSWKGRHKWDGLNTAKLPVETRRHIANARKGAHEAAELSAELRQVKDRANGGGMMTASFEKKGD